MRLINTDEIKYTDMLAPMGNGNYEHVGIVTESEIDALPTVDAVPVIRCKDCKLHGTNGYRLNCVVFCCTMPDDGFCSGGERREDETS